MFEQFSMHSDPHQSPEMKRAIEIAAQEKEAKRKKQEAEEAPFRAARKRIEEYNKQHAPTHEITEEDVAEAEKAVGQKLH